MVDIASGIRDELRRMAMEHSLDVSFSVNRDSIIRATQALINVSIPSEMWISTIEIMHDLSAKIWCRIPCKPGSGGRASEHKMTLLLSDPEFIDTVFEFVRLEYVKIMRAIDEGEWY
jgi:hypothetical protein